MILNVFNEVSYAHRGCIYVLKNTVKHSYCQIVLQFKTIVLQYIQIEHNYFKLLFYNITVLMYMWSNKCNLGEQKTSLKIFKMYYVSKHLKSSIFTEENVEWTDAIVYNTEGGCVCWRQQNQEVNEMKHLHCHIIPVPLTWEHVKV